MDIKTKLKTWLIFFLFLFFILCYFLVHLNAEEKTWRSFDSFLTSLAEYAAELKIESTLSLSANKNLISPTNQERHSLLASKAELISRKNPSLGPKLKPLGEYLQELKILLNNRERNDEKKHIETVVSQSQKILEETFHFKEQCRKKLNDIDDLNMLLISIIYFILFIILFYTLCTFNKKIARPLSMLEENVEKIGRGDLSHKIQIENDDEIGRLANGLNQMTENLQEAKKKLKEETDMLSILIDALPCIAMIVKKDTHQIVTVNRQARNAGAIPGKKCYKAILSTNNICPFCEEPKMWKEKRTIKKELFVNNIHYEALWIPLTNNIFVHYLFDISERKKIEKKLIHQKYYLSKAQELGHIGTWELDIQNDRLTWTNENYKIFGIKPGTPLTYEDFLNCVHPDDRNFLNDKWKAALKREPYEIEHRIISNGKIKWVKQKSEFKFDEKGHCFLATGFTQDITESKIALEKIINMSKFPSENPNPVLRIDTNGKILYANEAAFRLLKYQNREKKDIDKILPSNIHFLVKKAIDSGHLISDQEVQIGPDLFSFVLAPVVSMKYVNVYGSNISKRKLMENILLDNISRFKELFNNMKSGVAVYSAIENGNNFVLKDLNKAGEKIENIKKGKILGKKILEAFPGIEKFGLLEVLKDVYQDGKARHHPVSFYHGNKVSGWRENYVYKLPSGEIVAIYDDVTDEKKAQEELKKYRKHLENLVLERTREILDVNKFNEDIISTIPSALLVIDESLTILTVNKKFYTLFTLNDQKAEGLNFSQAIEINHYEEKTAKITIISNLKNFYHKEEKTIIFEHNLSQRYPKAQKILRFYVSKIEKEKSQDSKKTMLLAIEDITTAKILEQKLVQSERLAATGRLAASIAHEINNPLQGISTHLDLLKDGLPAESKKLKNYQHVKANIQRIGEIVRQLLDAYRPSRSEKTIIDINELILQVKSLIQHQMSLKNVKLELNLTNQLPKISGWPQQMHQILLNLLLNALESITGEGKITVSTFYENNLIKIQIKDTGKGISEDELDHIFDPFVSSKQNSGVGLGLFVCKGLIKNHNGEISVESKENKGSIFKITLRGEE